MDLQDPNRFPLRRLTSPERFLGVSSHGSLLDVNHTPSGADELSEDDVVFLGGDYAEHTHSYSPNSSSSNSSTPRYHLHNSHHNHHSSKGFGPPEAFGILAALPSNETPLNGRNALHLLQKSSVSSGSSSSSSSLRIIPAIPKPAQDRNPSQTSSSSAKFHHQSAPVNVPILTQEMMKRRRYEEFDEVVAVDEEDDEQEEMLPPHVMVARKSAQTCSVLEGAGRTLKGRDLRMVRNAVWRQTGFID